MNIKSLALILLLSSSTFADADCLRQMPASYRHKSSCISSFLSRVIRKARLFCWNFWIEEETGYDSEPDEEDIYREYKVNISNIMRDFYGVNLGEGEIWEPIEYLSPEYFTSERGRVLAVIQLTEYFNKNQ